MTPQQISQLTPGIYLVHWKGGDERTRHYAAVGITVTGQRWLAPCDWQIVDSEYEFSYTFGRVDRVEKIEIPANLPPAFGDSMPYEDTAVTPRTDIATQFMGPNPERRIVLADFARTLERENDKLRAQVEILHGHVDTHKEAHAAEGKPSAPDVLEQLQMNLQAMGRHYLERKPGGLISSPPGYSILMDVGDCLRLARAGKEWKP